MFKAESGSARFSSATGTDAALGQPSADRANGRGSTPGDVGFVGLGRMGTAMAKNLATAGHRVTAYVRRPQQMGTLLALGLKPTTDLADLFGCEVVISMLPDDDAVREVVLGQQGHKGLVAGLAPGAIHLSMSTISTAATSQLASAHARCGQGLSRRRCSAIRTRPRPGSSSSPQPARRSTSSVAGRCWTSSGNAPSSWATTPRMQT
jgi:NAD binding domain of 6-phosphogluconate dehydrogenase